ncbi:MAG: hypothetical protein GY696_39705, partial [Gammaproteobacteria bacterium]|nr:hypothetical protein [Gammaproteobacteria bacterium]
MIPSEAVKLFKLFNDQDLEFKRRVACENYRTIDDAIAECAQHQATSREETYRQAIDILDNPVYDWPEKPRDAMRILLSRFPKEEVFKERFSLFLARISECRDVHNAILIHHGSPTGAKLQKPNPIAGFSYSNFVQVAKEMLALPPYPDFFKEDPKNKDTQAGRRVFPIGPWFDARVEWEQATDIEGKDSVEGSHYLLVCEIIPDILSEGVTVRRRNADFTILWHMNIAGMLGTRLSYEETEGCYNELVQLYGGSGKYFTFRGKEATFGMDKTVKILHDFLHHQESGEPIPEGLPVLHGSSPEQEPFLKDLNLAHAAFGHYDTTKWKAKGPHARSANPGRLISAEDELVSEAHVMRLVAWYYGAEQFMSLYGVSSFRVSRQLGFLGSGAVLIIAITPGHPRARLDKIAIQGWKQEP